MGEWQPISLGIRSNPARNKQAGNARLINCFAEEQGEEGKSVWIIYATEGLVALGERIVAGRIKELLPLDGNEMLAVAGQELYAVDLSGVHTLKGAIPSEDHVYMRRNRRVPVQVGIVTGNGFYFVYENGVLTEIVDSDLPDPTSLAWLDGYGIIPISNGRYMITGLDDFTTIDGLDEGVCESKPDEIVRVETLEREALFFGTESLEFHGNTGDADFPIERAQAIELGCLAARSVARVDTPDLKTLMWVAPDHTVRKLSGYGGSAVSSNEVSELIKTLTEAGRSDELRATAWANAGRFFYALTCDDWTRVYDSKTGFWHDRKSYGSKRWRIGEVCRFGNKLIAGDQSGQLYEMKTTVFDEDGDYLVREVIAPHVHAFPYCCRFNALKLDVALGVGLNSPQPFKREPKMLVDWSDDDGDTWDTPREIELGKLGEKDKTIRINRMGMSGPKGRLFRFRVSAPVESVMMSVFVDMDILETG